MCFIPVAATTEMIRWAVTRVLDELAMTEDDLAGQFKKPELEQLRALVGRLSKRLEPLDEPPDEP